MRSASPATKCPGEPRSDGQQRSTCGDRRRPTRRGRCRTTDRRVAARHGAGAPEARSGRDRPGVPPRGRWHAPRGHRRVRDLGHACPRRVERRARLSRPHRRLPHRGSGRRGSPGRGLVGRSHRSGPGPRHRSLLRRLLERPRRMPGHHRPGEHRPAHRHALRVDLPGRHDPRHGARAGPSRHPSRHRTMGQRRRRLDGWNAGPRVGRHVPRPGVVHPRHRDVCGSERPADRLVDGRPPRHPGRPGISGRRLLRRRPR